MTTLRRTRLLKASRSVGPDTSVRSLDGPPSVALPTATPRSCELGLCQARCQQDLRRKVCSRRHVGGSVGDGDAGPGELTLPAEPGRAAGRSPCFPC